MAPTVTRWGPCEPASLAEIAAIFRGRDVLWWIAGGYAIELAVGRPLREHGDIDVLLLRRDQLVLRQARPDWDWQAVEQAGDPGERLRPWRAGEYLGSGVRELWGRPGPGQPWQLEIVLDESEGGDWVSRRDPRVRRPLAQLGAVTADGVPYLAPEVALYYKAGVLRPKDEIDFAAVLPQLGGPARAWLRGAIGLSCGPDHPWRARLGVGGR
jgi:hypothetical protein